MTRAREINQTRGRTSEASQHLDFQGFNQHQHLDDKKHHHCDHWSVKSFKIEAIFWRKNLFLAAVLALLDKTWRWVIFLLGCPYYHINIFLITIINLKLSFQNDFCREKSLNCPNIVVWKDLNIPGICQLRVQGDLAWWRSLVDPSKEIFKYIQNRNLR